jgi:hypothetical protein
MSLENKDRLVEALSELVAETLDDEGESEILDALSGAQLRRLVDAGLSQVLRVEREAGRSVDELLTDETELLAVLDALEGVSVEEEYEVDEEYEASWDQGGYEIGGGTIDEEGP